MCCTSPATAALCLCERELETFQRSYERPPSPRSSNTLHVLSGTVFRLCERININTAAILLSGENKGQRRVHSHKYGDAVTDVLLLHKSEIEPVLDHIKDVDLGCGWSKRLKPHPFIIVDVLKRGS